MSTIVQPTPVQPSPSTQSENNLVSNKAASKKTVSKKTNGTPPCNNKQPLLNPKPIQPSPNKNVPIAAKPTNNQIPIAPILPKQPLSKQLSPNNKQQKQNKTNAQQKTSQTQNQIQPQSQQLIPQQLAANQQPRVLFNGNLQSILAAVNNSNNPTNNLTQQQLSHQLSAKQQQLNPNQMLQNNQFFPNILTKNPAVAPKQSNSNNQATHEGATVFTATTTPDGQIIFSTMSSQQQMNSNLQQQLMQQNFLNVLQSQNSTKGIMSQQPIIFGQNQFNNLIQQQGLLQQNQQQQHQQALVSQPVAASTPTPVQDNTPENMLRQKLLQEEQKFQQLQQQLKNSQESTKSNMHKLKESDPKIKQPSEIAIKPKLEFNQTLPNENISIDDMAVNNNEGSGSLLNTSDPGDKRRGRPRLYVKNPLTGKSIKGKRLDGTTVFKPSKPPKIIVPGGKKLLIKTFNKKQTNQNNDMNTISSSTNGVFPSPSTSISSSHSIPPQSNKCQETIKTTNEIESNEDQKSGTAYSSSEVDTDSVSSEEKQLENNKQQDDNSKVLTHVIEGYLVKESPTPFKPNLNSTLNTFTCDFCKSNKPQESATDKFCSLTCSKRHVKKLLKKSRKSLESSSINRKENRDRSNSNLINPAKALLLEDTTNNLGTCMKSKCKSHHKHHKHRKHHGSSSSSLSREKIKKKNKMTEQTDELLLPPPIQSSQTSSQGKLTYQQSPHQLYNNTFSISLLNQSYTSGVGDQQFPPGDPVEWDCDQVFEFVKYVAGVNVAQIFKSQEVDGSALSLIRDDHLVNTMQIKLGPALKIMSKFNELKTKSASQAY